MRTITAMFDSRPDAENARFRLAGAGISEDNVTIHDKTIMGDHDHVDRHREPAHAGASDGRAGTHRDALGNFVDNRTDKPVGSDFGSDRNAVGDFVDGGNHRRGEEASGVLHRHGDHDHSGRDHVEHDDDRSLWDRIKAFFSDDDDVYAEGLRRGGYLLTARVEDHDVERAIAILDVDGIVDLDERQASWRQDGWAGGTQRQRQTGAHATRVRTYDRSDWPL